jgi:hypothetical protein
MVSDTESVVKQPTGKPKLNAGKKRDRQLQLCLDNIFLLLSSVLHVSTYWQAVVLRRLNIFVRNSNFMQHIFIIKL